MLRTYFVTAIRNLQRHRAYALMNAAGLTLGMACALAIYLIIRFETSFDAHYPHGDRLFKILTEEGREGERGVTQASPGPLGELLASRFPFVEKQTTILYRWSGLFTIRDGDKIGKFQEERGVAHVDPVFCEMFDVRFLHGDASSLSRPDALVLTETQAKKFFGTTDPIGKVVRFDNSADLIVTGVIADFPANTDFQFTSLLSFERLRQSDAWIFDWGGLSSNVQTYILLREGVTASQAEIQWIGVSDELRKDALDKHRYLLQPVQDIHFSEEAGNNLGRTTSWGTILALSLIGVFLILTACINFVNMATAQAVNRAREVGVRKALGALRRQLVTAFLVETHVLVAASAVVAIGILEVMGVFIARALEIQTDLVVRDVEAAGVVVSLVLVVSLLAGVYPAFVLSRFLPVTALQGKARSGGLFLRRSLVVMQFAISQMLMIGTLVVVMQMDFLQDRDMGFVKDGVVVLPLPDNDVLKQNALKTRLTSHSGVENVSFSYSSAISGNVWTANVGYFTKGHKEQMISALKFADADYADVYGLRFLAGRNLTAGDTIREFLVNESFLKEIGILSPQDAIGQMLQLQRRGPLPIVGVVADFHATSLHEPIAPVLISTRTDRYQEVSVRLHTVDIGEIMKVMEDEWNAVFPDHVFEATFLDERIASLYEQESRALFLSKIFAGIAIVIGCIGLLGLVSFLVAQKTKEIGIRKVLGATVTDIASMFSREFVVLILIAFAIAAPAAYLTMQSWLDNFAYRISLGAGLFIIVIAGSVGIAGLSVGYRVLRAATANPVESLRYE